ncbi:MAG: NifB/NifX family molybdenum-iron cluster-binding protein [Clostridia bacterium]|nr:NifB/NifX family molybdenum-iron cluster-binding protein [Clostridia bacterium]
MRIAISTDGRYVSPHFGRCPSFTLVDIENGKTVKKTEVKNPGHSPGYIPKFLHDKGVKVIICGSMGARARGLFEELDIETIMGVDGGVDQAIEKFEKGILEGGDGLCTPGAGRGYGVEKVECDHEDE